MHPDTLGEKNNECRQTASNIKQYCMFEDQMGCGDIRHMGGHLAITWLGPRRKGPPGGDALTWQLGLSSSNAAIKVLAGHLPACYRRLLC